MITFYRAPMPPPPWICYCGMMLIDRPRSVANQRGQNAWRPSYRKPGSAPGEYLTRFSLADTGFPSGGRKLHENEEIGPRKDFKIYHADPPLPVLAVRYKFCGKLHENEKNGRRSATDLLKKQAVIGAS